MGEPARDLLGHRPGCGLTFRRGVLAVEQLPAPGFHAGRRSPERLPAPIRTTVRAWKAGLPKALGGRALRFLETTRKIDSPKGLVYIITLVWKQSCALSHEPQHFRHLRFLP